MKILFVLVILGIIAVSGIVTASAYSIENMWASFWYTTEEDNIEQVWIWNPEEHEITHRLPDEEMDITHIGNWDLIDESDGYTTQDYIIEGEQSNVIAGPTLPVLIGLDGQITLLHERVDYLEQQLILEVQRTISLEKKLTELQLEMVELKNQPTE